jgi:hypothetical protein
VFDLYHTSSYGAYNESSSIFYIIKRRLSFGGYYFRFEFTPYAQASSVRCIRDE